MYRVATVAVAIFFLLAAASMAPAQVYEFTADYCGACRTVAPLIEELVSQGYPIEPIDVQTQPGLAQQYGVNQIPCFVAVKDGEVVGRVVGATGREELVRLCQLTQAAPAAAPPSQAAADNAVVASTTAAAAGSSAARAATVRLRIEDDSGHSFGTGTIIDVHDEEALVLTCGHIFRASGGKGRITCELFCAGAPGPLEGKLVCYDMRRDVGLVSVSPGVAVSAVAVGGTGRRPQEGDGVFSLGCDRGNDPSVIQNQIRAVNRYHGPANLVVGGRPVDGRSGGGLFSADGVLIGVCNAADQERDEGLYAALGPIHAELDRAGLGFIYRNQRPQLAAGRPRGAAPSGVLDTQQASAAAMPDRGAIVSNAVASRNGSVSALLASDRPGANDAAELICIIRDTKDTQGRSRVFVIDRPPTDLVRELSQAVNRRGPHAPTQMHTSRQDQSEGTVANGWRSSGGGQ